MRSGDIHLAVKEGDIDLVKKRIKEGVDVNARDEYGRAPLHIAARGSYIEVLKLLLRKNASVNLKENINGMMPIHLATQKGEIEAVRALIEFKAEINASAGTLLRNGDKPLQRVTVEGFVDVLFRPIENKGYVEANVYGDQTPLHFAVGKGDINIVELLLEKKANVNATDSEGITPFYVSAIRGHSEAGKILIKYKANIALNDISGVSPLQQATVEGNISFMNLLIESRVDINSKDVSGMTALHEAISHGHKEAAWLLLKEKPDVNGKGGEYERTPLHLAACLDWTDIAKQLIESKATVNSRDKFSKKPLNLAVEWENVSMVKLLVEKKSDVSKNDIEQMCDKEIIQPVINLVSDLSVTCCSVEEIERVLRKTKKTGGMINIYLNASHKQLNDIDCENISKALKSNQPIRQLNLSANRISYTGARRIAEAVPENDYLRTIDLSNNRITCCLKLFTKLDSAFCKEKNNLKTINLGQNFIENDCKELFIPDEKKQSHSSSTPSMYRYGIFCSQAKPVISLLDEKNLVSNDHWIVALVCKKGTEHAMLYMEGMGEWGQRFFERYHITAEGIIGFADVLTEDVHLKSYIPEGYSLIPKRISRTDGRILRDLIEADKDKQIEFSKFCPSSSRGKVNCLRWCLNQLQEIDIHIEPSLLGLPSHTAKKSSCSIQ